MKLSEGTKSYLFGCHQFLLHPLWVLIAWRLEYKSWPKWWELVCIFLHDIGICGREYLSNKKAKKGHWYLGARESSWLFNSGLFSFMHLGLKPYLFIAGHSPSESGHPESKLYRADKRSWLVAPIWWLWWNYKIEKYKSWSSSPREWQRLVRQMLNERNGKSCHELYLENIDK